MENYQDAFGKILSDPDRFAQSLMLNDREIRILVSHFQTKVVSLHGG